MPVTRFLNSLKALGLILVGVLVLGVAIGEYSEFTQKRERARLALSILEGQLLQLQGAGLPVPTASAFGAGGIWVEASALRRADRWLVIAAAMGHGPLDMERGLRGFGLEYSKGDSRVTYERWLKALRRWQVTSMRMGFDRSSPGELLDQGRQYYFEASGYYRVRKSQDGRPLELWALSLLKKFVEREPNHPHVPEALYLIGSAILRMRHSLPGTVRPDRVLSLVPELYPDSLWALRANAIWRDEIENGI